MGERRDQSELDAAARQAMIRKLSPPESEGERMLDRDVELDMAKADHAESGGERKRYLVLPGRVYSRTDGDDHFISASQLMHLYGVDPRECVIGELEPHGDYSRRPLGMRGDDMIELRPDYSGRYQIPRSK